MFGKKNPCDDHMAAYGRRITAEKKSNCPPGPISVRPKMKCMKSVVVASQ